MRTTTLDTLVAILATDHPAASASLGADTTLASLGIDSLGLAELLFNIEDRFGITLPAEPVALLTLGEVAGYIDTLLPAQAGPASAALPA